MSFGPKRSKVGIIMTNSLERDLPAKKTNNSSNPKPNAPQRSTKGSYIINVPNFKRLARPDAGGNWIRSTGRSPCPRPSSPLPLRPWIGAGGGQRTWNKMKHVDQKVIGHIGPVGETTQEI